MSIEDVRKKHEMRYNVDDINESSYCDHLRMREVDELFAALDKFEQWNATADQYCIEAQEKIKELQTALDAERGKVERLEKSAEEHPPHDDKCKCDFCYFARLLRQILTGEG